MKESLLGLFAVIAVFSLLASCSSRQELLLHPDGSGTASVHVELSPLVARYLTDLMGVMGDASSAASPLFDLGQIRSDLEGLPGVTLLSVATPTRDSLDLSLFFTDLGQIVPASPRSPLSFQTSGQSHTVSLELSQETLPSLLALPPIKDNPVLSSLGPRPGHPYTEQEYLGILDYAFSDYASTAEIKSALESSTLTIRISVDGTITAQTGGTLEGNSVLFRIPLVDLVTLAKPIDFSLTFR